MIDEVGFGSLSLKVMEIEIEILILGIDFFFSGVQSFVRENQINPMAKVENNKGWFRFMKL